MADPYSVDLLTEKVLAGSRGHIARAITLVESSRPDHRARARELMASLTPHTRDSIRVGVSGVPGAGKSTFIDALGVRLIEQGHRIAVVAVDPSSTKTGGSILGDRTRMAKLTSHEEAFVRPSPSGGELGGVARATRESMTVLEAAGFKTVLVETVGVGQSEVAVAGMVDTFLMLALSRSGDQLQGIKRGILEMVNVIAVNKADGDNEGAARVAARELSVAMKLISSEKDARRPPVIPCSAYTGMGLDEVWEAVMKHRAELQSEGDLLSRRAEQQVEWLWSMATNEVLSTLHNSESVQSKRAEIEAAIRSGEMSSLDAVDQVLDLWRGDLQ